MRILENIYERMSTILTDRQLPNENPIIFPKIKKSTKEAGVAAAKKMYKTSALRILLCVHFAYFV